MSENLAEKSAAPAEIGVAEAADMLLALEEPAKGKPTASKAEEATAEVEENATEATEDEAIETASDEPQGEEDDSSGSDEDEAEASSEDEGEPEVTLDDNMLVTIKIDGKTEQVTLKEVKEGFQRQADYSRKMGALAEQRKQLEAVAQQVQQERQAYSQLLPALEAQLRQEMEQEPDWNYLYQADPARFAAEQIVWQNKQQRLAAIQAEKVRLSEAAKMEEMQQRAELIRQGQKYLLDKKPEWKDPKRWEADRTALREYGAKVGFSDEDLSNALDPRAILVLEKAMKYDRLIANRPKPQRNEEGPRNIRSQGVSPAPKAAQDVKRLRERLSKTGSVEDAAKLFGLLG